MLGAALVSELSSFIDQNVYFDVANPGQLYDIGDGVVRVEPPFRGGYSIVVGSANFVTAFGTLTVGGEAGELLAGTVTAVDDEDFEPQPFFTNRAGRFALQGLAPGKTYRVVLADTGQEFDVTVPAGKEPLYRMGTLDVPASN